MASRRPASVSKRCSRLFDCGEFIGLGFEMSERQCDYVGQIGEFGAARLSARDPSLHVDSVWGRLDLVIRSSRTGSEVGHQSDCCRWGVNALHRRSGGRSASYRQSSPRPRSNAFRLGRWQWRLARVPHWSCRERYATVAERDVGASTYHQMVKDPQVLVPRSQERRGLGSLRDEGVLTERLAERHDFDRVGEVEDAVLRDELARAAFAGGDHTRALVAGGISVAWRSAGRPGSRDATETPGSVANVAANRLQGQG